MEFKHFSHPHGLSLYHMAEGSETLCSGCKLGGLTTVYMCWPCQFFLHEQCFQANRSMAHPSHPPHPLTLLPCPTYPSASFLCNSCHQAGTGFSYGCSDCDFDLHVHCAYSTLGTTPDPHPNPNPALNYSFSGVETSNFNTQYAYPPSANEPSLAFHLPTEPVAEAYPLVSHPPPVRPYAGENQPALSETAIPYQPIFNSPSPQYAPPNPSVPGFSCPADPAPAPFPAATQPAYPGENQPAVAVPGAASNAPVFACSNPQIPSTYPASPSFNDPASPAFPSPANSQLNPPQPTPVSFPVKNQAQPHDPAPVQPAPSSEPRDDPTVAQSKTQVVKHFSHQHALRPCKINEEEGLLCSGCEQGISGPAYSCTKSKYCDFRLHKSCFELPKEIKHKAHKTHPLTLLSTPPCKNYYIAEFTCNACYGIGNSFVYHCSSCNFDLHVQCAFLQDSVKRADHEHPLSLLFSSPYKKAEDGEDEVVFMCDVCQGSVDSRRWVYYCKECDFGTEVGCINVEAEREEEVDDERGHGKAGEALEELSPAERLMMMQSEFQRMQIQMKMSQQLAQSIAGIGHSLSNLV